MKHLCVILLFALLSTSCFAQQNVYEVTRGSVYFHSDAQQELIKATSDGLSGVVDVNKRTFLFKIKVASFEGFNSQLQREHFNENYLESEVFPTASYAGRIVEDIDLSKDGEFDVRTRGKLMIHGCEQQCLIKAHVVNKKGIIDIRSDFTIMLADYNIKVPRIVYDKLSPEISITVTAHLKQKS